jgi:hypothetical protein
MEYSIGRTKLSKLTRNKTGSFSILFVILIFVLVVMIDFFVNILIFKTTINEIEGLVNSSADSAIRFSIDSASHRSNRYELDEYQLRIKFEDLVSYSLRDISYINREDIVRVYIDNINTSTTGIGDGNRLRYQTTADFVVELNISGRLFRRGGLTIIRVGKRMVYSSSS